MRSGVVERISPYAAPRAGRAARGPSTPRTSRNWAAMYVSMIQKAAFGSCGQSATPVAIRVSESMKRAPPSAAGGPRRVAPYAMAVTSRL